MLKLSESFSSTLIQYLIISKVSRSNGKARSLFNFWTGVRIAVTVSLVDAIIIGGISFFSSMIVLGYENILLNIKISLFSAMMLGGLTLFNTLKSRISKK